MGLSDSAKRTARVMAGLTLIIFCAYVALRIRVGGSCARPTLKQDFDTDAYLGIWYELRRDKEIPFETGECVTAQYSLNDNGTVRVYNAQYYGFYDSSASPE